MRRDEVSVLPLQKLYLQRRQEGYSPTEIARWCDLLEEGLPSSSRLLRLIGLRPRANGEITKHLKIKRAAELVERMHADPVDVDL